MLIAKDVVLGNSLDDGGIPVRRNPIVRLTGIQNNKKGCISFSDDDLSKHILNIGGTGAGKTNVIVEMTKQIKSQLTSRDVMIVFDTKNDFVELHGENDSVITNAMEERLKSGIAWNIFMELVTDGWDKEAIEINADEIANLIFAESIEKSQSPFFPKAAKDLFAAILKGITFIGIENKEHRVKYMNNDALKKYLSKVNAKMLCDFLKNFPELSGVLKYIGDGSSEQALGVLAELEETTGKIFRKAFGLDGRFSVRKFVKEKGGRTLFIEYDLSCGSTFIPMYKILFDMFLKQSLCNTNGGMVYVICDELKLLPHLLHLEDGINFGRSVGVKIVAGIQSMEQLYEVYGEIGGKNIASGFQTTICFHTNNQATRDYIKGIHGSNYSAIQHMGASNNLQENVRDGFTVEDWDMANLGLGEAIVGLPFEKPIKFKFERYR
nr:type IV secretion system DNA-binding domain-containing protein [Clostridium sp. AF20-17LB]